MFTMVTGASSGIGLEMAKTFAAQKQNLILVARGEKALNELASELRAQHGVQVEVLPKDLALAGAAREVFSFTESKAWVVSTLVNNAGFGDHSAFANEEWQRISDMVQVNITSLLALTHLYLPGMLKANSGNILNVASTAAFQPGPLMAVYYATKAFVLSFTEALHEELSNTKIHVSALCPGPTESNFQAAARVGQIPMLKIIKVPSSRDVAEYGISALKSNCAVAIHGKLNFLLVQSLRISPRKMVTRMVRRIQEKR